jgi:hypothetical protein
MFSLDFVSALVREQPNKIAAWHLLAETALHEVRFLERKALNFQANGAKQCDGIFEECFTGVGATRRRINLLARFIHG